MDPAVPQAWGQRSPRGNPSSRWAAEEGGAWLRKRRESQSLEPTGSESLLCLSLAL